MDFNYREWNVDLIQSPQKLMDTLKSFNIKEKKIKDIKVIGNVFNLVDGLEEEIYKKNLNDEESNVENFKDEYEFKRIVEIDEPIIITFDNGDRLEIDYSDGSTIKMGLNSLPENIHSKRFTPNLDMNVMFSDVLGEQVIGFEVSMQDEPEATWDFTGCYDYDLDFEQETFISQFRILLTNAKSIVFRNCYDYGHVYIEDFTVDISKISWKELKEGIKNRE